jgi:hypothetical protein
MTPDESDKSVVALIDEYATWTRVNDLPPMSADELLYEEISDEQRRWLSDFIRRWNEATAWPE